MKPTLPSTVALSPITVALLIGGCGCWDPAMEDVQPTIQNETGGTLQIDYLSRSPRDREHIVVDLAPGLSFAREWFILDYPFEEHRPTAVVRWNGQMATIVFEGSHVQRRDAGRGRFVAKVIDGRLVVQEEP